MVIPTPFWNSLPPPQWIPSLSPFRVQATLTNAIRDHLYSTLIAKRDQGNTYRTSHLPTHSNYWVKDGNFLRFCDWRFIHRARLNLLPVNGARRWDPNSEKKCRRCGAANETLAHVLNVCPVGLPEKTKRHDAIHNRLKNPSLPQYGSHPQ